MQLQRMLAGFKLDQPLMNGAGTCKNLEQVFNLARSVVSAVVLGSVTMEARTGNPGTTYHSVPGQYALNSLGMPNPGLQYYLDLMRDLADIMHDQDKPLIVSVAGMVPNEYSVLAHAFARRGADLIELNLGCPNVWEDLDGGDSIEGGPKQKGIPSFEPELVEVILGGLDIGPKVPNYGVKLSPIGNPALLEQVAGVIGCSKARFVTTCNTFPNAYLSNSSGQPVLGPTYGGMSGAGLKPIALGQVRQLRAWLPEHIDIIGVGGVRTTRDVIDFLEAGATAVQATTAYMDANEDPGVYSDVLRDIMEYAGEDVLA